MAIEVDQGERQDAQELSLPIEGMTCASCVRRVEKALAKVPGVQEASVNLATERARVVFDPAATTVEALGAAVEKAGYRVGTVAPAPASPAVADAAAEPVDEHQRTREREIAELKRKWQVSLV